SIWAQLRGLVRLTRWKEYVPFVIPLTVLGALLATRPNNILLDWRLVAVTAANILAVAYAFMINDIEDAPDDARDPARAARNPITTGEIGVRIGYNACRVVAAATLILYAMGGLWAFGIGGLTLLLSHFYSWRPVRLKAWPVTDIISHSLMLSGLLLLAGYFTYHTQPGIVWLVAASVTLISVYGQLYNQLRDFEMDKAAGLNNTAIVLGENNARRAMYVTVALAAVCLLAAIVLGVFPLWLGLVLAGSALVSMMFRPQTDMRGGEAVEISGGLQIQGLLIANLTIAVWLVAALASQINLF
ncbi:MAG TPA: UbiA family prenyltransferase, partial [Phototrophicaceae bacterium]|nr:UbiA family prenyltransferase [Phototrophicaceae bacterium]